MYLYKISVIIPVYNAEKYLQRCVESILNQSLQDIEIILIDDQSTDRSPSICDDYAQKENRIKVVHKKNEGPGCARNSGLEIAEGEFIAFVDADDYIEPLMYETMYQEADRVGADSCICGFSKVDEKGNCTCYKNPLGNNVFVDNDVHKKILLNIIGSKPEEKKDHIIGLSVWKTLYSSMVIKEHNIRFYSDRIFYSEDTLFNIDYFIHARKVVTCEEAFYNYVENATSFTKTYKEDMHQKNIRFYNLADEKLKEIPDYIEAKLRLSRLFLGFVRYYLQRIVELYSMKQAICSIKNIICDKALISIISAYPFHKNPIKQRIIHFLVYKKLAVMIWAFIYLNRMLTNN